MLEEARLEAEAKVLERAGEEERQGEAHAKTEADHANGEAVQLAAVRARRD